MGNDDQKPKHSFHKKSNDSLFMVYIFDRYHKIFFLFEVDYCLDFMSTVLKIDCKIRIILDQENILIVI